MRRITLWLCSTATAVVLLLSYHTSTAGPAGRGSAPAQAAGVVTPPTTAAPATTPTTPATPAAPGTAAPGTAAPGTAAPRASASTVPAPTKAARTVVNGTSVDTRYGPVQVQITVSGGRITAAQAIDYPQDGRDGEINGFAIPALVGETLSAQSAHIDTVSGATFTSEGYRTSLQAALDAAHLS